MPEKVFLFTQKHRNEGKKTSPSTHTSWNDTDNPCAAINMKLAFAVIFVSAASVCSCRGRALCVNPRSHISEVTWSKRQEEPKRKEARAESEIDVKSCTEYEQQVHVKVEHCAQGV